ncbi:LytR/AlgR family response regulator transcription factor [Algoriphagus hitonicola]|uniref:Two component transcriptional regulator, LytTR family n=1 Tax=Algoriphagus hitonicola TaxID=435880 RepID=A0A1I2WBL1_9BACT|nr:LytTR family transcriptional regulator DNA-binding domain-containing protein [Algoriphagus hitonicola]SFG98763.1 two component transcriptional regulator, LytTR family [Algoriphagus hitonicola]
MIRTLIIDDEPLAASVVREFLSEYAQFELMEQCSDGFEGLKAIQKHQPDLIFLDVQMPKITGFEMLELLDEAPAVIFTTAFDQYALKAFDTKAIDYLLKPFSQERFNQAIQKFLATQGAPRPTSGLQEMAEKSNRLVVRVKNEIKIIAVSEVLYFEGADDYIAIYTEKGKFLKKMTMKSLEEALAPDRFARIHRSYMLNVNAVTRIEPYEKDSYLVFLKNGEKLPVSKTGYGRLRQVLGV